MRYALLVYQKEDELKKGTETIKRLLCQCSLATICYCSINSSIEKFKLGHSAIKVHTVESDKVRQS